MFKFIKMDHLIVLVLLAKLFFPSAYASVQGQKGLHTGSWNDSVKIEVPAGISGVAPNLSISHNHGLRDGLLGSNYNLEGLSVITRRSITGGVPEVGDDDIESTFYLDGSLLVPIYESNESLTAAIEHRNLVDSQLSIHYEPETYTGAQLKYDSQRNLWVMKNNGWTWEYGQQEEAGNEATVIKQNLNEIIDDPNTGLSSTYLPCNLESDLCNTVAWHLSRSVDSYGNEIIYNYKILSLSNELQKQYIDLQTGWPVIDEIRYAEKRQSVTFSYQRRPDPRLDSSGGVPAILSHRLDKIESWVDDSLFSDYRLSYQDEKPQKIDIPNSILWKVDRRATDGSDTYRNIRELEVDNQIPRWFDLADDENEVKTITNPGGRSGSIKHVILPRGVNLNDDGVTDLLVLAWHCSGLECVSNHRAYLSTPSNDEKFIGVDQASGDSLDLIDAWNDKLNEHLDGKFLVDGRGYLLADFDNDYRLDLLVENSDVGPEMLGDVKLISHRGGDTFVSYNINDLDACKVRFGQVGDVNGDGYIDLIQSAHEATGECSLVKKTRWVANTRFVPHFDWSKKKLLAMPMDQEEKPEAWREIVGGNSFESDMEVSVNILGNSENVPTTIKPSYFPITSCQGNYIGPPKDFSDFDSAKANLSKFSRFGDYNSDGVLDVLYTVHGCYNWLDINQDDDISYWVPVEDSLYSEIFYGKGDGSFIASGLHAGHPLYDYSEGWVIPGSQGGGISVPPTIVDEPETDEDREPESSEPAFERVLARSSSGWLSQDWYQHQVSPFNADRGHYSGLMIQLGEQSKPTYMSYDRGLVDGYLLSNEERIPDDIQILPAEKYGDNFAFGDFDGDGFIDYINISVTTDELWAPNKLWETKLVLNNKKVSRGRTISSKGPYGGTQHLTWGFSAQPEHDNPLLPINLEVLTELDGKNGYRAYRYAEGLARYGKFRGFAHAELINERGGRTVHGYYTDSARIGLQKYGVRYRDDESMQHVSVSAFGRRNLKGNYSSNLVPPYFSPLIRQCEYELGLAGNNDGGQTENLDDLITRCYSFNTIVSGDSAQNLELEVYENWIFDKPFLLWKKSDQNNQPIENSRIQDNGISASSINTTLQQARVASTHNLKNNNIAKHILTANSNQPLLNTGLENDSLKDSWLRSPDSLRWKLPENIIMPVSPDPPKNVYPKITELLENITDYFYDHEERRLDSKYEHQDTSLIEDNRISEYKWEKVGAGEWYRLIELVVKDYKDQRFERIVNQNFDPNGFDNAKTVLRCGVDDDSCLKESKTWSEKGRLVSAASNDDGKIYLAYQGICGVKEHIDPVGRISSYEYDELCRKKNEQRLTSSSEFSYDGFNRVHKTAFTPGDDAATTTIYTLQDDNLSVIADVDFIEPRLARLRHDGQLELIYLDDFGRLTRKLLCRNNGDSTPSSIDEVSCKPGTELITDWKAYSNDGKVVADAQPYFESEAVRLKAFYYDELGKVYAKQYPDHTPINQDDDPKWLTTTYSSGPGWIKKEDALNRVFQTEFTTLTKNEFIDGVLQTEEKIDVFGRSISIRNSNGVTENYSYDNYNRLALLEYTEIFDCWKLDKGSYVYSQNCRVRQEYGYDANGRQNLTRNNDGTEQVALFDRVGRPLELKFTANGVSEILNQWEYHDKESIPRMTIIDENLNEENVFFATLGSITEKQLAGSSIYREFGIHGKPVLLTDENGLVTQFEYDLYDRLVGKTVADKDHTKFEYNGQNRITKKIDADGVVHRWDYSYSGKLHKHYQGDWLLAKYNYDAAGRKTKIYENGVFSRQNFDLFNNLILLESGLSSASANDPLTINTYTYDKNHRLVAQTAYPVAGKQVEVTYEHNAIGLLQATYDANGSKYSYAYDQNLNLHQLNDPEGYTSKTAYDSRSRIVSEEIPGSGTIKYRYDSALNLPGESDSTQKFYSVTTIDGELAETTNYYDARDQLVLSEYPDGSRLKQFFSGTLLASRLNQDNTGQTLSETRYVYENNNWRLQQVVGPDSRDAFDTSNDVYTVDYNYTDAGRLSSLSSPVETIKYRYGASGFLEQEIYPDNKFIYSRAAEYPHLTRKEDKGRGETREYLYSRDRNAQLEKLEIRANGDTETRNYSNYNIYGMPEQTKSELNGLPQVGHKWGFTKAGQLASRETFLLGGSVGTTTWQYYNNGVLKKVKDPSGNQTAYHYGAPFDYRLTSVDDDLGHTYATVTNHNDRNQVVGMLLANKSEVNFSYDELGRELGRTHQYEDGSYTSLFKSYDALGRVTRKETETGEQQQINDYEYDGKGRLTRETQSSPELSINYQWDLAGNLISKQIDQGGQLVDHYSAKFKGNRLLSANGETIEYDAWGGVVEDQQAREFKRLPSGLIKSVITSDNELQFFRDSDGISWGALQKDQPRPMIDYWRKDYSALPLLSQGADKSFNSYISGESGFIYDVLPAGTTTPESESTIYDQQASLISSSQKNLLSRDAFGESLQEPLQQDLNISGFNYHGMNSYAAIEGLHFARYRAYDPTSARFLSSDPAGLKGGFNHYGYVHGDPVNLTDTMGLFAIPETSFNDFGGSSFIPPILADPWPDGNPEGPFGDPGWGKDGCPITAMCATGSNDTSEEESDATESNESVYFRTVEDGEVLDEVVVTAYREEDSLDFDDKVGIVADVYKEKLFEARDSVSTAFDSASNSLSEFYNDPLEKYKNGTPIGLWYQGRTDEAISMFGSDMVQGFTTVPRMGYNVLKTGARALEGYVMSPLIAKTMLTSQNEEEIRKAVSYNISSQIAAAETASNFVGFSGTSAIAKAGVKKFAKSRLKTGNALQPPTALSTNDLLSKIRARSIKQPTITSDSFVFRGDRTSPSTIFSEGWKAQGSSTDLLKHALDNTKPPSMFVSTSKSSKVARDFGQNIYVIRPRNGIDVNKVLGRKSPFPSELEIAIPYRVNPSDIVGVTLPRDWVSILNPNFKP